MTEEKVSRNQVISEVLTALSDGQNYSGPELYKTSWIRKDFPSNDNRFQGISQLMSIMPDERDELVVLVAKLSEENSAIIGIQYYKDSMGRATQLEPPPIERGAYTIVPDSFQGNYKKATGKLDFLTDEVFSRIGEISKMLETYARQQVPMIAYLSNVVGRPELVEGKTYRVLSCPQKSGN